jgi:hypothetical protein
VDLGTARGWNVWQLENGDWAWSIWDAASVLSRSGVEATEATAEAAATQALEFLSGEARAAGQSRRELPVCEDPHAVA